MDNSFLRLTTDFNEALLNENPITAKIFENRFVQMFPEEIFLQITNSKTDISFAGNIKSELINCHQEVLQDITDVFFIDEFTDIHGIKQIAFEFGNIGIDYGTEEVYLKLSHTVSDKIWYSSPFTITYNQWQETTRFDYKHRGYFRDISYDRANYFQGIRLRSYQNDIDVKEEIGEYTQSGGNVVSMQKIITDVAKGLFKHCNNFTFKRAVTLFAHDTIYINNYKSSNKPSVKKSDRLGTSNFFGLAYEWNPTEDYRKSIPQINVATFTCALTVSSVVVSEDAGIMTVTWANSAAPFDVLVEISLNDQLTWDIPDNFVLDNDKNECLYSSPNANHHIRITPLCGVDNSGTPTIASYLPFGDYHSDDYTFTDYETN